MRSMNAGYTSLDLGATGPDWDDIASDDLVSFLWGNPEALDKVAKKQYHYFMEYLKTVDYKDFEQNVQNVRDGYNVMDLLTRINEAPEIYPSRWITSLVKSLHNEDAVVYDEIWNDLYLMMPY